MVTIDGLMRLDVLNQCAWECTRQSRWKETTQRYLSNMLINNVELRDEVLEGRYKVRPTVDFVINERGHIRQIEAPVVRDRIVQKTLTKHILSPILTKGLIYDNYASLPKRGTSFARKRFETLLQRYYRHNGSDGYIMLIDIRKYFDSIDHDVLKELIAPYIADQQDEIKSLISYVIDTSSHTNKGLNLGSEAPQIFAIFYLDRVDRYVKVVKGVKYYGRYMDDMFVIGKDKTELKALLDEIEDILSYLRLEINRKKTQIVKLSHGFTFLQIKYSLTPTGKIIKQPSHSKIVRERRRLKAFRRLYEQGKMTELEARNCYGSWRGAFVKEHNAYRKTLQSMDGLYKQLFPYKDFDYKEGRIELTDAIFREAHKNDLKLMFNS